MKCQIYPLIGNYIFFKVAASIEVHYIPLAVLAQYAPPADTEWSTTVLEKKKQKTKKTTHTYKKKKSVSQIAQH